MRNGGDDIELLAGPATRWFMAADFPTSPDVYEGWNEVETWPNNVVPNHYPKPSPETRIR